MKKTITVNQIRTAFLDYFAANSHEIVPSSPLVPHNDPSLMFTNAGMVQFKNIFTGSEKAKYKRAASSQKCVRAGGKHNDLENVGYTARHHTFFEMLGNFSFGDYFKEGAIKYAWEFLTKELEIDKNKLLVTVYHDDEEAFALWKKIASLSEQKIIRIASKDNFWAMGDTGPCGPCSEIFYDHGSKIAGGLPGSREAEGDRFVEIWNLVFMQFEQINESKRVNLPAPSIDTGMGLERIAAVLQGVHDNYDIDLFKNLIATSKELSGNSDSGSMVSHRVIADHLRSCAFLLGDGVMPANEGRGYVLRRIMRRAMRHARQLGCTEPLLYKLVPTLVQQMGDAYEELKRAQSLITEILRLEEEKFGATLDRGLKLLEEESAELKAGDMLSGAVAFKLYDTYGFPLDLTSDILKARRIAVDEAGFDKEMQKQKERARAAWKGSGSGAIADIWFKVKEQYSLVEFLGYRTEQAKARVEAVIKDDKIVENAGKGDDIAVVLNQTPFYGEAGGQEGDHGVLTTVKGAVISIYDTKKYLDNLLVHFGRVEKGDLTIREEVTAIVDENRRQALRANHSATHILHAVLRKVLGEHVTQKGSLVAEDRLRFDISHPTAISYEQLIQIEKKVNTTIWQNSEVVTRLMTTDEAIREGACALFGEKYGDEVRVVSMAGSYSVELCGGTHVTRTGDIGLFKIVSESAVAAGIRRIEALTGEAALNYINNRQEILVQLSAMLKTAPEDVVARLEVLLDERKKLKKELEQIKKNAMLAGNESSKMQGDTEIEVINGINFLAKTFVDVGPKALRDIVSGFKDKVKSGIVVVASSFEGKASLIVAVTPDLTDRFNAVDLVKSAADSLGAKGAGGKPEFAQTGGNNIDGIERALAKLRGSVK